MPDKVKILDKYPYDTPKQILPEKGPIGTSTNPQVVNQLSEFQQKIRQGYTGVEIQTMQAKQWMTIPKQIFEEIARSARINEVQLTIHAPIQDLQIAGFDPQRNYTYTEDYRKDLTRSKLYEVVRAAGEMAKIYGENIKINVHIGEVNSANWDKDWEVKVRNYLKNNPEAFNRVKESLARIYGWDYVKNIKSVDDLPPWVFAKDVYVAIRDPIHNAASLQTVSSKEIYDPRYNKENIITVAEELAKFNRQIWESNFLASTYERLRSVKSTLQTIAEEAGKALYDPSKVGIFYNAYKLAEAQLEDAERRLEHSFQYLRKLFKDENELKKYFRNNEEYQLARKVFNKVREDLEKVREYREKMNNLKKELEKLEKISLEGSPEKYKEHAKYVFKQLLENSYYYISDLEDTFNQIGKISMLIKSPPIAVPTKDIAKESIPKTIVETYSNYINWALKEKHETPDRIIEILPSIMLEGSYASMIGTRPEEAEEILKNARIELKKFIESNLDLKNAVIKKYGSVDKYVEDKIALTLDVGHIKMFEKYGYSKEDIINWVKKMKPYIKHLHVHDVIGGEDVHLPPGMSWDDTIKAEIDELRDKLAEKGVSFVLEPGGWYVGGFAQEYGMEYPYSLHYGGYLPYGGLSYEGALFRPEYFMSWPAMYSPVHAPQIYVTRYSPFGESWSQLPPHLGSRRAETFSGQKME